MKNLNIYLDSVEIIERLITQHEKNYFSDYSLKGGLKEMIENGLINEEELKDSYEKGRNGLFELFCSKMEIVISLFNKGKKLSNSTYHISGYYSNYQRNEMVSSILKNTLKELQNTKFAEIDNLVFQYMKRSYKESVFYNVEQEEPLDFEVYDLYN
jgi:hypothetical protein